MQDLRVTFIQANLFWEDREKNLDHFDDLLNRITDQPDLVLLPEMFNTGFSINPEACAETMEGPSMDFLRSRAENKNAVMMATLLISEGGNYYNRLVCMYPDGRYETYDKRHLFRFSGENVKFTRGGQRKVFVIKGWKILPLVCYDLRFPVWSKNRWAAGNYEFDLLVCLANWPACRSYPWKTLLAARALENQAYVAGVNRVGDDGHGTWHSGDSMILDAKGIALYSAPEGAEDIGSATCSAENLKHFRDSYTIGMDWDHFSLHV
ncbi:MAG: nitrilase-related carbon-nitrogen hydrolase [Bacteroidota bacterium]